MEEQSKLKGYIEICIMGAIGATVLTYLSCSSCAEDWKRFLTTSFFSTLMWIVMWIGNGELAHFLSIKIPWVQFPIKRFVIGVISTVVFTVCVAMAMLKVWEFAWGIKFKSYQGFLAVSLVITFLISLFLHGREFLLQWKRSAVEAERYLKESMTARYENLKNQVNPHFLFNSLNALTNLVYEDQAKAVKFIKQLSEVYRYVLDSRDKEVVPLEEELKFLDSYLYLQKIRFGDKLTIDFNLNGVQSQIAPLALQMLIENAIKHNIVSEDDPLLIKIYSSDNYIVVENNLQKKGTLGESSGIGLENICKRYEFLSNKKVDVFQDEKRFVVKLPLL